MKKILLGFNYEVKDVVYKHFNDALGQDYEITIKTTKHDIFIELSKAKYEHLIVAEYISPTKPFLNGDYNRITDDYPEINVVLLLSEDMRGTKRLEAIYNMGIYNCLFGDTKVGEVSILLNKPRNKSEARFYYGLSDSALKNEELQENLLSVEAIRNIQEYLAGKEGDEQKEEFLRLARKYNQEDIQFMIKNFSSDLLESIKGIKDYGISDELKRRKNLSSNDAIVIREIIKRETDTKIVSDKPVDFQRTIAVVSLEKGIGGTTLASNMASYFASKGIKTSLMDTDYKWFDLYYSYPLKSQGQGLGYIISDGAYEKVQPEVIGKLSIFSDHFKSVFGEFREESAIALMRMAKAPYTVNIIDVAPDLGFGFKSAIYDIADIILVVVSQDFGFVDRLEVLTKVNGFKKIDFVINQYDSNVRSLREKQFANIFEYLKVDFIRSFTVPHSEIIHLARSHRKTVIDYGKSNDEYVTSIKNICDYYYTNGKSKKNLFGGKK